MPTFIKPGFWEKKVKGYKEWLNLDQLIESKITPPTPTASYKVYTALLTQSGSSNIFQIGSGLLTIGVTYQILEDAGPSGWDFTNVGAPNNTNGTYFVATGTTPNSWTNAQLQYNTGDPVATVLENTIGNIWFSYQADGFYRIVSNGLFLENKTYVSITDNRFPGDPTVDLRIIKADLGNDDVIDINTLQYNIDGGWNGGGNQNYILLNTPIEIRVYN